MAEKLVYTAVGRRKESIARVRLSPGTGKILVNNRSLEDYFPRPNLRMLIVEPLKITSLEKRYDIESAITGGGMSGQAGALRHGLSRAIVSIDEKFRSMLRKAGMLTRDPRMKERKKYGQKGARKRFQFSKR